MRTSVFAGTKFSALDRKFAKIHVDDMPVKLGMPIHMLYVIGRMFQASSEVINMTFWDYRVHPAIVNVYKISILDYVYARIQYI